MQADSEDRIINSNDFKSEKIANAHSFHKSIDPKTGQTYIHKYFSKISEIPREECQHFYTEIQITSKLNHPSILKFCGYCLSFSDDNKKPSIFYEYVSSNTLNQFIESDKIIQTTLKNDINSTKILIILYGIASGMSYLHEHNIQHLNLTSENIFLDENQYPKISGFHFSREINSKSRKDSQIKGTVPYIAPEILTDLHYSEKCDVYSYAIIIYELLTKQKFFPNIKSIETLRDKILNEENRPEIDKSVPECYKKLIEKCWSQEPNERPTFSDILHELKTNDEFITDSIDADEYRQYIRYIESSEVTYKSQNLHHLDEVMSEKFKSYRIIHSDYDERFLTDPKNFDLKETKLMSIHSLSDMYNMYLCQHKSKNLNYLARVYKCEIRYFLRNEIVSLCREVNIMSQLNHPAILKFVGFSFSDFYNEPRPVILFQAFEDTITLEDSKNSSWDDTKRLINMYGIASGMRYLHEHKIVHRDLKTSNIYLDQSYYPKIGGFQLSKEIKDIKENDNDNCNNVSKHLKGTPAYLSPETYDKHEYSEKSDVYSYSLIIYELITNRRVFEECHNSDEIRNKIVNRKERPPLPETLPTSYRTLIERCWSQEPKDRPTFSEIIEELKTNDEFITESIDIDEYHQYINYIDEYDSTFEKSKRNAQLDDVINTKLSTFHEVDDNFPMESIYSTNINNISVSNVFLDMNDFEKLEEEEEEKCEEEEEEEEEEDDDDDDDVYGIINVNKDCFCLNKIRHISTNETYISKEYIGIKSYIYQHIIFNFIRELKIIVKLNHPAIVKCIGFYPTKFYSIPTVVTEYASKGPLSKMIKKKSSSYFNDTKKLINMYGIASGMRYLHEHKIVHRDLKTSNIYLDQSYYPKIGGFQLSKEIKNIKANDNDNYNNVSKHLKGTPAYLSPETYDKHEYSEKSDVYSYSLIIYELITNRRVFEECHNSDEIRDKIVNRKERPPLPETLPTSYRTLIERCWSQEPKDRPTFSEIIEELKTNDEFITESIDIDEYHQYIKHIETSKTSFEPQDLHLIDDYYLSKIWQFPNFANNCSFLNIYETETNNIVLNLPMINLKNFKKQKLILHDENYKIQEIKEEETENLFDYKKPIFDISKDDKNENIRNYFRNEICNGSSLSHPSLLKMIGYSPTDLKNKPNLTIIYQHSTHGMLKQILEMENQNNCIEGWDDTAKLIFIYGIASCLSYLHSNDIIHYDLNMENIFVDDFMFPKITGIRIYREQYLNQLHSQFLSHLFFGTNQLNVQYASPEVLGNTVFDKSVDVFSFAMIVYEIISKVRPFKNKSYFYIKEKILDGIRPEFTDKIPKCYRTLIERCWAQDPNDRLTSDEIVFELKTNPEFISETIDKRKYYDYIKLIDESLTNKESKFEDLIQLKDYSFYKVRIDKHVSKKEFSLNMGSVEISKFEKKNKIGSGSFGNVYKVLEKETGLISAAKVSKYEIDQCEQNTIVNLKREIEIISQIDFPSILKFIGYSPNNFKNKMKPVVITEFSSNGTLSDVIKLERQSCGNYEWDDTKKLINIYGIATGMKYLHQHNIIHRDLKPENILLDEYLFPKIADFGLSKQVSDSEDVNLTQNNSGLKGTYAYCAPEILKENLYTTYGDVYAFGLIVYEIMTTEVLYEGFNQFQLMMQILKGNRPSFKYPIPSCYRNLIESCWAEKYDERPSFDEIVELLETDQDFITENVDEDAYLDYIFYLKETFSDDHSKQPEFSKVSISEQNQLQKADENIDLNKKYECFLDLSKYELQKIISKSDISKLYKVKEKSTGIIYSGEISLYEADDVSKEEMTNFANEVNDISHLNHPTFLKFIGYSQLDFKNKPKPTIISELCLNNTLKDIIDSERSSRSVRGWDETKKLINIYGIASGMSYLHSRGIIHRNLKLENIFLDDYLFPKIGNFGLLIRFMNADKLSHQSMTGFRCSPIYSSPEVLQTKVYSKESDVYAFAFILFQIITGEVPFGNLTSSNQVFDEVVNKEQRPSISDSVPRCYKVLIEKCWSQDPSERPSFEEVAAHLRMDPEFITEKIKKEDFLKYVEEIENKNEQKQRIVESIDDGQHSSESLQKVQENFED